ncbi:uncharacterized protein LOC124459554 [Xenia sp. Carnegie-2017]|uniref:uncharacterized protein LOC124459554 n=1 Tax=Xenia sp. Carnegie-2017 TaxID=2897299 RepID=UPI001F04398B|nr:uncharacterized protein LOC124459554 [Xenia sp. Carnegie-2017]
MGFAKKTLNTNAKCINCQLPACNLCTVFEENEDVSGLILDLSVGYCMECQLKTEHGKREDTNLMDDTERSSENFDYEVQLTSSPSQEAINSELQGYDSDATSKSKCRRKKSLKSRQESLEIRRHIITSSEYYKKKLIVTNTKNQKNSQIYVSILTELKSRCDKRREQILLLCK